MKWRGQGRWIGRLGAALGGAWAPVAALAVSLGDMADSARSDLELVPGLIAGVLYVVGALLVFFGLMKLKRHTDHPQQTTIGSGIISILIGVALILAPAVINGLADSFGITGGETVVRPKL